MTAGVFIGVTVMALMNIAKQDSCMDEVDMTAARTEREAEHLIEMGRKKEGPTPNGRCHYCDEIVADHQRWCDVECRDQWSRENERVKR